ncbi:MAG TPA: hypothetical protein VJ625_01780 [Propionibacteriaceae bacterium]|nr:hypothetical protein [Propionibacteriaceae bacterium]
MPSWQNLSTLFGAGILTTRVSSEGGRAAEARFLPTVVMDAIGLAGFRAIPTTFGKDRPTITGANDHV